jgi:hypothetical protein
MHEKTIFHWDDPLRLELQLTDATVQGWERLRRLDRDLLPLKASPGGSADLLAATPERSLFAWSKPWKGANREPANPT